MFSFLFFGAIFVIAKNPKKTPKKTGRNKEEEKEDKFVAVKDFRMSAFG
jgi:hypothetical protein